MKYIVEYFSYSKPACEKYGEICGSWMKYTFGSLQLAERHIQEKLIEPQNVAYHSLTIKQEILPDRIEYSFTWFEYGEHACYTNKNLKESLAFYNKLRKRKTVIEISSFNALTPVLLNVSSKKD